MCMTFGCNPQIKFCYIFRSFNLVCDMKSIFTKKSPLFQFEIAFNNIWIFLTPKGDGGETSDFVDKNASIYFVISLYCL